jgi:hypothetical protein
MNVVFMDILALSKNDPAGEPVGQWNFEQGEKFSQLLTTNEFKGNLSSFSLH